MPTHQSLSGASDDELLGRMVKTHPERFGEAYWKFFEAHVAPHLPPRPTMIDLGCGPGLFLRDLGQRHPAATLYGYDVTPDNVVLAPDCGMKYLPRDVAFGKLTSMVGAAKLLRAEFGGR